MCTGLCGRRRHSSHSESVICRTANGRRAVVARFCIRLPALCLSVVWARTRNLSAGQYAEPACGFGIDPTNRYLLHNETPKRIKVRNEAGGQLVLPPLSERVMCGERLAPFAPYLPPLGNGTSSVFGSTRNRQGVRGSPLLWSGWSRS